MTFDFDFSRWVVTCRPAYYEAEIARHAIRAGGGWYEKELGTWKFPADLERIHQLVGEVTGLGVEVSGTERMNQWLDREEWGQQLLEHARAAADDKPVKPLDYPEMAGLLNTLSLAGEEGPIRSYPFQTLGAAWLAWNHRAMLLDDMGLGKTRQAILAAVQSFRPKVVICPNSLKGNWVEEIVKHGGTSERICVPDGSMVARANAIGFWRHAQPEGVDWLILNYEMVARIAPVAQVAIRDSVLILDEAHRVKNGRAQVTKAIRDCRPETTWLLTGTPVANRPEDLWSLCDFVRPGLLGWNWWDFDREFIRRFQPKGHSTARLDRTEKRRGLFIIGYNKVDEINRRLASCSLRRVKGQVLQLPEKVVQKIVVPLDATERRHYEEMRKDLYTMVYEGLEPGERPTVVQVKDMGVKWLRLRQLTHGLVSEGWGQNKLGRHSWVGSQTKLKTAHEIWQDAGCPPCVVWCNFLPVMEQARTVWATHHSDTDLNSPCFTINGDVPQDERLNVLQMWQVKQGGVLLAQMDVAGEGLNLQHAALEFFVDVPLTPKQKLQCEDRLHRIGQNQVVNVIYVLAEGTVDVPVYKKLETKVDWAQDVLPDRHFVRGLTREQLLEVLG